MKRYLSWKNSFMALFALTLTTVVMADTCTGGTTPAQNAAIAKANSNVVYQPKNNLELNNYNARQAIADDPTTILWCTGAFPIPSSPLFTVPILGKLTSSTKRPFSTTQTVTATDNTYSPELPGPDGMYGPSDSYRYGFTPSGVYVEFSGSMDTFCTTEPTTWQRQNTNIVVTNDTKLSDASTQCQSLLKAPTGQKPSAANVAQCQALLAAAVGK